LHYFSILFKIKETNKDRLERNKMNDKKDKVSIIKEAKAIHQQDKEAHQREVNEIIQETYYAPGSKQRTKEYQKAKTMK
jgi:hypothetical protein